MPKRVEPKHFYLNEQHELSHLEREGGGRLPKLGEIDWASKQRYLARSLSRTRKAIEQSSDPLRGQRYFLLARPEETVPKLTSDKRKAPSGHFDEPVDYAGKDSRVLSRLGLDVISVTDQGAVVASVNRDLACLSKILSMAFDNELIDSNPMRRVRLLKENGSRERFITAAEEVKLFAKLTGRRDHIRSVVTVALNTGMRRGEILDLQWEHVNFIARTLFIARSKTGKTRTIPMNDIVFEELKALKQDAGTRDFVFSVSKTGVNIDSIKTGWRNA